MTTATIFIGLSVLFGCYMISDALGRVANAIHREKRTWYVINDGKENQNEK